RIRDGILPDAPIFGDIKTFIRDGYAASYQGLVDVLTAGFPCQPFSVAGKQKGEADERNMWPATATVVGIVKPRFVLLENVPGVRSYLPVVVRDLRRLGYEVSRPLILGADNVGAPHRRKRIWILADTLGDGSGSRRPECEGQQRRIAPFGSSDVADSIEPGLEKWEGQCGNDGEECPSSERSCGELADAQECECQTGTSGKPPCCGHGWPTEPDVGRVANGVASRVDRLKALGNGQVPRVVATAWRLLTAQEVLPL
ncbi:MAG: DNA cytosine methyltransferase, partial [Pseudomonadota bacterium]